jgi:hypothetical protein
LGEAADVPTEVTFAIVGEFQGDGNLLSNDFSEIHGGVFGKEFSGNTEGTGDCLVSRETEKEEDVFPKWSFNGDDSVVLGVCHKGYALSR